jgi:hypothetical protein
MPDPIKALPYELWIFCIELAIDGQWAGPLDLLMVSARWEKLLMETPSLWTQIYIQNGDDEKARISTFMHLSKGCSLHVDIMTPLRAMDTLQLIADKVSRVGTISIRPGASETCTVFKMGQWKQAASSILGRLSSGLLPTDLKYFSCFGISLKEDVGSYYYIILMQFTRETAARIDGQNRIISAKLPVTAYSRLWEDYIAGWASFAHW